MKVCYLDHYDSFSNNLIDCLFSDTPFELVRVSYDDLIREGEDFLLRKIPLIVSPGPHRPEKILSTVNLIRKSLGTVPILGVCLGHQCLGYALGGKITRAGNPFHGSKQQVLLTKKLKIVPNLAPSFEAAHYNSLVIENSSISSHLVWARNRNGEIAGIFWGPEGRCPALGLQFHPESFLSEETRKFSEAWICLVKAYYKSFSTQVENIY